MKTKIRLWNNRGKKYIYPDNPDNSDPTYPTLYALGLHGLPIAIDEHSFIERKSTITGWNIDHHFEPEFFTGLHDADGREIWEGDIVEYHADKYTVSWRQTLASFILDPHKGGPFNLALAMRDKMEIRVIGNIHENTEEK